ncbi:DUF2267 domain-containing protein [Aliihoeflea sp. PC F10.4]
MPMPLEYARASADFDRFMEELRVSFGHDTRHQTYQTVESVLRVFRLRLSLSEAIAFADALPSVLRSIFVKDWDTSVARKPFSDFEALNREVREFRRNHDFSPPDAIRLVAKALHAHVDPVAFESVLACLPGEAREFWKV